MSALSQVDPGTNPFLPMFPSIRLYDNHLENEYNIEMARLIIHDMSKTKLKGFKVFSHAYQYHFVQVLGKMMWMK